MTTILVDIDDTLLDGATSLQKFIGDNYGLFSDLYLKDHHNIAKLFNVDWDKTLEMISAFHRSPEMGKMEPLPCAATVIPDLHRAGYKFIGITACLNEKETVEARKANLREVFGFEFEQVQHLGIVHTKVEALAKYDPCIWVDDLYHHALAGFHAGHISYLLNKPYNQEPHHPFIKRVVDWHEIAERLL